MCILLLNISVHCYLIYCVDSVGGYWPGDPLAKKHNVTISNGVETFSLMVPEDRYIYFYFEEQGIDLPIVNKPRMCRQGCCTICTGKVISPESEVDMDEPLGLLKQFRYRSNSKGRKSGADYVLTCCTYPRSDLHLEIQTEDEMYVRQWGEGFEGGGVQWGGVLPDDGE